jgi:hypothetical protein
MNKLRKLHAMTKTTHRAATPRMKSLRVTHEVQHHGCAITAHQRARPNCAFNVDAYMGHAFGMFMAHVGTLHTSCSGAS